MNSFDAAAVPVGIVLFISGAFGQTYSLSKFAGTVAPPLSSAIGVSMNPSAVAVDGNGSLYIADRSLNAGTQAVLKLDATGTLTRVAGSGGQGFSGDGGPAAAAQLGYPSSLALDAGGNLYIGDLYRIRKVDAKGVITTVAGGDTGNYSGDGGSALGAGFYPAGLAVDSSGNLYIADSHNFRIRKVTPDGAIQTIAGNGVNDSTGDGGPATQAAIGVVNGLCLDSSGNIYFTTEVVQQTYPLTPRDYVRKVSVDGVITTVAGTGTNGYGGDGGPAVSAQLSGVTAIQVDSSRNLYIADGGRIRKVSTDGTITTVAGAIQGGPPADGTAATGGALGTWALALDSKANLFIADAASYAARKISNGTITTLAGNGRPSFSGDGGLAINAQLDVPTAVAAGGNGSIFIADGSGLRIRNVSSNGIVTTIAGDGIAGVASDGQPGLAADLSGPAGGAAADGSGNVYFSAGGCSCIWKVTPDGVLHLVAGAGHPGYSGDGGQATSAAFFNPTGVAVNSAGDLFVADSMNHRVRKISNGGGVSTVAGNGKSGAYSGEGGPAMAAVLPDPQALALDGSGNLYIADLLSWRVLKVSPDGTIATVAGNGTPGSSGDGGPATAAQLNGPNGVAVDAAGSLYISEHSAIRRVSNTGTITTIASGISPQAIAVDAAGNVYEADSSTVVNLLQPAGQPAVTNAASDQVGSISPGEIITIYGSGLGPGQLVSAAPGSDGLYPTQLAGTAVTVNGQAAPMIYSWTSQVSAIVPYALVGDTAQVVVTYQGKPAATFHAAVAESAPAIFTSDASGTGQAAVLNQDSTLNGAASPAHIGDVVAIFATGEGQTTPAGTDGKSAGEPLPHPVLPVTVTIGGQSAPVLYAGGAPGEVAGVLQVNVTVPGGIQTGNAVPVVLQVGSVSSRAGVTIAVR